MLNKKHAEDFRDRVHIILVRPQNHENIGLVARNMKNTGYSRLRLVGVEGVGERAFVTAVHSSEILERAQFYSGVSEGVEDLDAVFAATAKSRKNSTAVGLDQAMESMFQFSPETRIGLLFGNERTGLTSRELLSANILFTIPQAFSQPSYNLASAVLLVLFFLNSKANTKEPVLVSRDRPLPRKEQDECIRLILDKLEERKFIHSTNRVHVTEMVYDLFGRLNMTEKDRSLLLAMFSKGI